MSIKLTMDFIADLLFNLFLVEKDLSIFEDTIDLNSKLPLSVAVILVQPPQC